MVATPYTMDDLKNVLAEVSGDKQFADSVLRRATSRATTSSTTRRCSRAPGCVLRKRNAGRARLVGASSCTFQGGGGARRAAPCRSTRALYKAGVDRDDLLVSLDGVNADVAGRRSNQVLRQAQARRSGADALRPPQRRDGQRRR